ncbi:MAG: hypothetical protein HPY45_15205 [Anaerolineae bacterium]|nr:hypothetical protein [Anaerolineae bacterium]
MAVKKRRRVIFLDIDGVLNSISRQNECKWETDPHNVDVLNKIVKETGAVVVISSGWRFVYWLGEIRRFLLENGVEADIVDVVSPFLENKGDAVEAWLMRHTKDVDSYVILDDCSFLFHEEQLDKLVETDYRVGLMMSDAQKAISMLSASTGLVG